MSSNLSFLFVFMMYGVIILAIALFASKFTKNSADYILGGRSLSGPVVALSAGASDMSGWLLMALPGFIYVKGLNAAWITISLLLGAYCNWVFIAKRLRVFTEVAGNAVTLPTFFANKFSQDKTINLVSAISILVFFTCYAVAGFNSAALLLQATFDLDYQTAIFISSAVIVSYTAIGGFLAVSWIDFFQGILMLFSLITVPIVTIVFLGGIDIAYNELNLQHAKHLNLFAGVTPLGMVSLLAWGFGYFGQPHIVNRFMAIRDPKELKIAKNISLSWMGLSLLGSVVTGLVGVVFFMRQPLQSPDTVFIILSKRLFSPLIAGILVAAVMSAIMSTVSSQIHMSASILLEDIYKKYIKVNASDKESLWAGRVALILISLIATFIALNPHITILQAVGFAWAGLGASFGPATILNLYWSKTNKYGTIAGILSGTISILLWGLLSNNFNLFNHPDILPGFELLPAFIISSLSIIIVSLITGENTVEDKLVIEKFRKELKKY